MKNLVSLVTCVAALTVLAAGGSAAQAADFTAAMVKGHRAHPTRVLAKLKPQAQEASALGALSAGGLQVQHRFTLVPGLIVIEDQTQVSSATATSPGMAPDPAETTQALLDRIESLRASGLFEYVEPDYLIRVDAHPNDARFLDGSLWGLRNDGQNGGVAGVDIDAETAWDLGTGSRDVIVAVVDTGIRATHRDLAGQMWRNGGEVAGNGVDDDRNGYVDDVYGINAIVGSGDSTDDDGHGTHVAAIIGAGANDGEPLVGVAWQVRLMACKFLATDGEGATSDAVECIDYAAARGAQIVNCSWGSYAASQALYDAVAAARGMGMLLVAAAGNEGVDTDRIPHYPSSIALDNVISVAAIDRRGGLAGFSNYGAGSVHLGAPGVGIYSAHAASDSAYASANGTSMAAAYVSGVAVLVRARFPADTVTDVRDHIVNTTQEIASLMGKTIAGGYLDAQHALAFARDNQLEVAVSPPDQAEVFAGHTVPVVVRVTDVSVVTGATVTARVDGTRTIYFGDDGVAPDLVAGDARYTAALAVAADATQVQLLIRASAPGRSDALTLATYRVRQPPPNDRFADRTPLEPGGGSVAGTNEGAQAEVGEPEHAGQRAAASVWWTWTAPSNRLVTLNTDGSSFDTRLAVYTGSELGALSEVASNDDVGEHEQSSRVQFNARAGTTFQIAVDGFAGDTGSIRLAMVTVALPSNDFFADAVTITGPSGSVSLSVSNATREPGEPVHGGHDLPGSVWWKWTAPGDCTAVLSARSTGSPGAVVAYEGDTLAELSAVPGLAGQPALQSTSTYTFLARTGVTYRIAVACDPRDYYEPRVDLALTSTNGPVNDRFDSAIRVPGSDVVVLGSNVHGTRERGEPWHGESALGASVWWSWTAPYDGTASVSTAGGEVTGPVQVYTGSALNSLQPVAGREAAVENPVGRVITFRAVAGTTYHVAIDAGAGSEGGNTALGISLVPTPANDDFATRSILAGSSAAASGTFRGATLEAGELQPASGGHGLTLWWTWTAPRVGTVLLDVPGEIAIEVFRGSELANLSPVTDSDPSGSSDVVFHVEAGETIQMRVDRGHFSETWDAAFSLSLVDAPSNDMFADRLVVAGASASLNGVTAGGTIEDGEFLLSGPSVWWSWTAPETGMAVLTPASGVDAAMRVRAYVETATDAAANLIEPEGDTWPHYFRAMAGTTYAIQVQSTSVAPFAIELALVPPPANDDFANRAPLVGLSASAAATNVGATIEPGEPGDGSSFPMTASVWWRWTAPAAGTAEIAATSAGSPCRMAVFTGDSLRSLIRVGPETPWGTGGVIYFSAIPGTTYQIVVDCMSAMIGDVSLDVSLAPPPANDAFAASARLVGSVATATGTNVGALHEPGGEQGHNGWSEPAGSVWWSWTAPGSGGAVVTTAGSDFPTDLSVYTGPAVSQLSIVANARGTEDGPGVSVGFRAVAGTTYHIRVDGVGTATGNIALGLALAAPPPGDDFAGRGQLSGIDARATGSTFGASCETGEPSHEGDLYSGTVWWSWTAPASGTAIVTTASDGAHPEFEVFTGAGLSSLVPVAQSRYHFPIAETRFHAVMGTEYHIAAAQSAGNAGAFELRLSLQEAPSNDLFADATLLGGSGGALTGSLGNATIEAGEWLVAAYRASQSLWWSWTAPQNGRAVLRPGDGWLPYEIVVCAGPTRSDLRSIASTTGDPIAFNAVAGTTYHLAAVNSYGSWVQAEVEARLDLAAAPSNDDFSQRQVIAGDEATVTGTNFGAGLEWGEPTFGGSADASVWWSWTPSRTGTAVVTTEGSEIRARLGVYRADSVSAGRSKVVYYDEDEGVSRSIFEVVAGTEYQIQVAGEGCAMGRIVLGVAVVDRPANDDFADSIVVAGTSLQVTGSNRGATTEPGEPRMSRQPASSVWWTWTAPASGRVSLSAEGSPFDVDLTVWAGYYFRALGSVAENVERQDLILPYACFDAVAGTRYHFAVGGRHGAMGDIHLSLACGDSPMPTVVPPAQPVHSGSTLTLTANVSGTGPFEYQWFRNGIPIEGATAPTFRLPIAQRFDSGFYTVTVSSPFDIVTSPASEVTIDAAPPSDSRLLNLSTRALCRTGDDVLIPGFVIDGSGTKRLLIRAVGPTLGVLGVGGVLPNPQLVLKRKVGDQYVDFAGNDDWGTNANADAIRTAVPWAFALEEGSADAALLVDLPVGQYTVVASDVGATNTGIAIVEFYDADEGASTAKLANLSNRGYVGLGDQIMIPGVIISDEGPKTLLVRAVGPGLAPFGVGGLLADPQVAIYRDGDRLLSNDDWGTGADAAQTSAVGAQVFAFPLAEGSADAAFVITLPAGAYTVQATGAGETTGVVLVEVYLVP